MQLHFDDNAIYIKSFFKTKTIYFTDIINVEWDIAKDYNSFNIILQNNKKMNFNFPFEDPIGFKKKLLNLFPPKNTAIDLYENNIIFKPQTSKIQAGILLSIFVIIIASILIFIPVEKMKPSSIELKYTMITLLYFIPVLISIPFFK